MQAVIEPRKRAAEQPTANGTTMYFWVQEVDEGRITNRHFAISDIDEREPTLQTMWMTFMKERGVHLNLVLEDVPEWLFDSRDNDWSRDTQRTRQYRYLVDRFITMMDNRPNP